MLFRSRKWKKRKLRAGCVLEEGVDGRHEVMCTIPVAHPGRRPRPTTGPPPRYGILAPPRTSAAKKEQNVCEIEPLVFGRTRHRCREERLDMKFPSRQASECSFCIESSAPKTANIRFGCLVFQFLKKKKRFQFL